MISTRPLITTTSASACDCSSQVRRSVSTSASRLLERKRTRKEISSIFPLALGSDYVPFSIPYSPTPIMKNPIKSLVAISAFAALALGASAQPAIKILVVDMAKLYDTHYKTLEQNAKIQ